MKGDDNKIDNAGSEKDGSNLVGARVQKEQTTPEFSW